MKLFERTLCWLSTRIQSPSFKDCCNKRDYREATDDRLDDDSTSICVEENHWGCMKPFHAECCWRNDKRKFIASVEKIDGRQRSKHFSNFIAGEALFRCQRRRQMMTRSNVSLSRNWIITGMLPFYSISLDQSGLKTGILFSQPNNI